MPLNYPVAPLSSRSSSRSGSSVATGSGGGDQSRGPAAEAGARGHSGGLRSQVTDASGLPGEDFGSGESDVEEHVEVERHLDHDLSCFEMVQLSARMKTMMMRPTRPVLRDWRRKT
uniref:Uncharacterized protein n=1 Tax=Oryza punctata TaxID=4537 RepID=A0A0E0JY97_ORYPU